MNWEVPDPQVGFRKDRGSRYQLSSIHWIIDKARESRETSTSAPLAMQKIFDLVDHNKPWKILNEMGVLDHLTCLLRNLYAGQEATIQTRLGTMDWFKIGKGVHYGCILSPSLFNLYAEHIMWNVVLNEAEPGIKIAGRNINNFR